MSPMPGSAPSIVVGINAVIIALTDGQPRVRHAILFGEAADLIAEALAQHVRTSVDQPTPITRCADLAEAVDAAAGRFLRRRCSFHLIYRLDRTAETPGCVYARPPAHA